MIEVAHQELERRHPDEEVAAWLQEFVDLPQRGPVVLHVLDVLDVLEHVDHQRASRPLPETDVVERAGDDCDVTRLLGDGGEQRHEERVRLDSDDRGDQCRRG